jgi:hypothetical protein
MDLSEFQELPDDSKVWIHGFERKLNEPEQEIIKREIGRFLPQWVSHGAPVKAAFTILFDQFVVTAVHCQEGISGCSVDSFARNLKMLKTVYGLDALVGGLVYYRDKVGEIQAVDQLKFHDVVDSGSIAPDTKVFNTIVTRLDQLRAGEFETTFDGSWHARSFSPPSG